jgi:hypothetical protein
VQVELAQHLQQLGPGYSGKLDTIMPFNSSTNSSNLDTSNSESDGISSAPPAKRTKITDAKE